MKAVKRQVPMVKIHLLEPPNTPMNTMEAA